MNTDNPKVRAKLLASPKYETSKWLQVVPSFQLGLRMDNNTKRIAHTLRLGGDISESHACKCGVLVDECDHSFARRLPRQASINKIISQNLSTSGFPNLLELISRIDGVTLGIVTSLFYGTRQSKIL